MKSTIALTLTIALAAIWSVECGGGRDFAGELLKIVANSESTGVIMKNEGSKTARLHCASGDDRIGDEWNDIEPGHDLSWDFKPNALPGFSGETLFYCRLEYGNCRKGWNVWDQGWSEAKDHSLPRPVKWTIKDDCVLDWNNACRHNSPNLAYGNC